MKNRKKIIIVAHCLLTKGFSNQHRDNMNDILKVLLDSETGIIQLPCPFLIPLPTGKQYGKNYTENDNRLFTSLSQQELSRLYSNSLSPFIMQLEAYLKQNFEIAGLVGIKNSQNCEVETSYNKAAENRGIFMKILKQELKKRAIRTNMVNIEF